jgi:phosphonopyruvate decarboxylase
LKPIINYVIDNDRFMFLDATNEGDAVAIASGVALAGGRSVVMFQNSGLGNAVNPLTSLAAIFQIPVLLLVTLRGEPGGEPDEPQHALMGAITTTMIEAMRIPWRYFPNNDADVAAALDEAERSMKSRRGRFRRESDVAYAQSTSNHQRGDDPSCSDKFSRPRIGTRDRKRSA